MLIIILKRIIIAFMTIFYHMEKKEILCTFNHTIKIHKNKNMNAYIQDKLSDLQHKI